jgi:hypothetical protein
MTKDPGVYTLYTVILIMLLAHSVFCWKHHKQGDKDALGALWAGWAIFGIVAVPAALYEFWTWI